MFIALRLHQIWSGSSSGYPDDNIFIWDRTYSIPFIMSFGDLKERIKVWCYHHLTNLRLKFILSKFIHPFWYEKEFYLTEKLEPKDPEIQFFFGSFFVSDKQQPCLLFGVGGGDGQHTCIFFR